MKYYFTKILQTTLDDAVSRVTEGLKKEGFGVLTEIDIKETLKKKLNVDFRKYRILGACNPQYALKALEAEDKIGTMMPCNVIVQEIAGVGVEISAIDPVVSLQAIKNPKIDEIARQVRDMLRAVIERL
jgi:uncharacterized protein (DUF302 family)